MREHPQHIWWSYRPKVETIYLERTPLPNPRIILPPQGTIYLGRGLPFPLEHGLNSRLIYDLTLSQWRSHFYERNPLFIGTNFGCPYQSGSIL